MSINLLSKSILATLLILSGQSAASPSVIAHFIVGNAQDFTKADWDSNIQTAKAAGLDGFALDVANDNSMNDQVPLAYEAAESAGDFKVFLQFDYAKGEFPISALSGNITKYANKSAQFKIQNKPLVSTFEGPNSSSDWASVKSKTGCYFAPDWTSQKSSNSKIFDIVDGALSWDIWPTGANNMTDSIDTAWEKILGNKTYIMGVSPWFYTNLPQYKKNWIARGASLWHTRWQEVSKHNPPIVEVITWNDFGESHYVGPNNKPSGFPPGSEGYVRNNPHDGWLATLPAYIQAFKSGNNKRALANHTELLAYAHTPNPVSPTSKCSDGGTTTQDGSASAAKVALDAIDVYAVVNSPAQVTVQIGTNNVTLSATKQGVNYFSVPTNGQTGAISYSLRRNGKEIAGGVEKPGISTDCSKNDGKINYNAITGSFKAK